MTELFCIEKLEAKLFCKGSMTQAIIKDYWDNLDKAVICWNCPQKDNHYCSLNRYMELKVYETASRDVLPPKEIQLDLFSGFKEGIFKKLKNYM